jgi:NADPH:quinone reductase-like Zn-dependent oxidoreductase
VGSSGDEAWLGREVVINPSFDWGIARRAQGPQFSILGLPHDGTLAEEIVVPVAQLTAKPPHLSWTEAAALPLAGLTAYRALFTRAALQPGERVLLSGIGGGVALLALQLAVAYGAQVWVTSSSPEKISRAVALGAKGGFLYTDEKWVEEAKKTSGFFDVVVDSAGGPTFDRLIDAAAPGGRLVFFGATAGDPTHLPMRKIFWRQLSLLGTTMGSPDDWTAMVEFVSRQRLKPVISDVFSLEKALDAFSLMERGAQFGKIVVTVRE